MQERLLVTDIVRADTNVRAFLDVGHCANVIRYHRSFPQYQVTPLAKLKNLAAHLGVASINVKDESYRFGLNSFKVLGGSYAMGLVLAGKLGIDEAGLSHQALRSPQAKAKLGDLTFVTATDGNHGRGVAWTAHELGFRACVYLPEGSSLERLANIRAHGADAEILPMNYDEAVRLANLRAGNEGWILVQDTAWEGYQDIPRWIMQGYATMAFEAIEQLGDEVPTHVFLQAGVGSMAGSVAGLIASHYGDQKPTIVIVEPAKAACIFETAKARDGELHFVTGKMDTIMAGLACGEPNGIAWEVLSETAEFAVAQPEAYAAHGMRVLGNGLGNDPRVISGESGAATTGLVSMLLSRPGLADVKAQLGLDEDSRILCFNTEGDTDRENYRRIVWEGLWPSYDL